MKKCNRCGQTFPLEDFPVRKNGSKDGREPYCKPCNRAFANERGRRYRERHPERVKAQNAASRARLGNEYFRAWYARNRESEQARAREVMRLNRLNHPEQEKERLRRYRAKNIDAVRAREREKTYARRALQPYSPELAQFMAELVTQPCTYCGATENITVDHVVPLSRGGKHEAKNLAPACYSCNASKCNRLLSEWKGRRAA